MIVAYRHDNPTYGPVGSSLSSGTRYHCAGPRIGFEGRRANHAATAPMYNRTRTAFGMLPLGAILVTELISHYQALELPQLTCIFDSLAGDSNRRQGKDPKYEVQHAATQQLW